MATPSTSKETTIVYRDKQYVPCLTHNGAAAIYVDDIKILLSSFGARDAKLNPDFFRAQRNAATGRTEYRVRTQRMRQLSVCKVAGTEPGTVAKLRGPKGAGRRSERNVDERAPAPLSPSNPTVPSSPSSVPSVSRSRRSQGEKGEGEEETKEEGVEVKETKEVKKAPVRVGRGRVGARELLALGEFKQPVRRYRLELKAARAEIETAQRVAAEQRERAAALRTSLATHSGTIRRQQRTITELVDSLQACRASTATRGAADTELATLQREASELRATVDELRREHGEAVAHTQPGAALAATMQSSSCARFDTTQHATRLLQDIADLHPDLVARFAASTAESEGEGEGRDRWRETGVERAVEAERTRMRWIKSLDVGDLICGLRILPPRLPLAGTSEQWSEEAADLWRQTPDPERPGDYVGRGAYLGEGAYGVVFLVEDAREEKGAIKWARARTTGLEGRRAFMRGGTVKALKIVTSRRADDELSADMVVEGVLQRALRHPNLVPAEMVRGVCGVERVEAQSGGPRKLYGDDDGDPSIDVETRISRRIHDEAGGGDGDGDGGSLERTPQGLAMLLMPYGVTLDEWRQLAPEEAADPAIVLHMCRELLCGLQHLWRNGFAHQDVKPANVLLLPRDPYDPAFRVSRYRAALTDFGLAKHYFRRQALSASRGSLAYMPPERVLPKRALEPASSPASSSMPPRVGFRALRASDTWALGCTFFELFFGGLSPFAPTPADERFAVSAAATTLPSRLLNRLLLYRNFERVLPPAGAPPYVARLLTQQPNRYRAFLDDTAEHGPPAPRAADDTRALWDVAVDLQAPEEGDIEDLEGEAETRRAAAFRLFDTPVIPSETDAIAAGPTRLFDGVFRWPTVDVTGVARDRRRKAEREPGDESEEARPEAASDDPRPRVVDFSGFDRAPVYWGTTQRGVIVPPLRCTASAQLRSADATSRAAIKRRVPTDRDGRPVGNTGSGSGGGGGEHGERKSTDSSYGPIIFRDRNVPGIGSKLVDAANEVLYRYVCHSGVQFDDVTTDVPLHLAALLVAGKWYNKTTRGYMVGKAKRALGVDAGTGSGIGVESAAPREAMSPDERKVYEQLAHWSTLRDDQRAAIVQYENLLLEALDWNTDGRIFVCNALDDARRR